MGLNYYADMIDAPLSGMLRQASINTRNQLVDFSGSSREYWPYTGISTGAYIIFYQGGIIDYGAYVPGPVDQSSSESDYNEAYAAGMALSYFRILIHSFLNKDPDIVP